MRPFRAVDHRRLGVAEIAHTDLHEPIDAADFRDHVVEDRCVRPGESFVRIAKIGVGVEMEDAEVGMRFRVGQDGAEGDGVIAAEDHRHFSGDEERARLLVHPVVDLFRDRIDLGRRFARGVIDDAALFDDRRGDRFRLLIQPDDLLRDLEHGDARFVRPSGIAIEQIDLLRRLEHRLRPARRPAAVRSRRLVRNGNDDDARIVGRERQAVNAGAGTGRSIGVERHDASIQEG